MDWEEEANIIERELLENRKLDKNGNAIYKEEWEVTTASECVDVIMHSIEQIRVQEDNISHIAVAMTTYAILQERCYHLEDTKDFLLLLDLQSKLAKEWSDWEGRYEKYMESFKGYFIT